VVGAPVVAPACIYRQHRQLLVHRP
jgi:hypothetical protein